MRLGARGKLFLVSLLLLDVSVVGSESTSCRLSNAT